MSELDLEYEENELLVTQLNRFRQWLAIEDGEEFSEKNVLDRSCVAPSIVTRSDAMMLGVSTPRFARRAYLNSDHSDFINLRRPLLFKRGIPRQWAEPFDSFSSDPSQVRYQEYSHWYETPPSEFLKYCPNIGDSVFSVPERFMNKFDVVCTNLLGIYEGRHATGVDWELVHQVPFLRQFRLSGQCSECALFMVNALMHVHAKSLYGLADLSAFQVGMNRYFPVRGADSDQITRIAADHLELNIRFELSEVFLVSGENGEESTLGREETFLFALNSYLKSGVPVLLPVDLKKMSSAYAKLSPHWPVKSLVMEGENAADSSEPTGEEDQHLIVLIGVSKKAPYEYLALDSASVPFLTLTAEELLGAVLKRSSLDASCKDRLSPEDLGRPIMAPVLPMMARGFLQSQISGAAYSDEPISENDDELRAHSQGLLALSFRYLSQLDADSTSPFALPESAQPSLGEFKLCRAEDLVPIVPADCDARNRLQNYMDAGHIWVWTQELSGWLFLWKAARPYDRLHRFEELTLGHEQIASGTISGLTRKISLSHPEISDYAQQYLDLPEPSPSVLSPSIITSFASGNLEENLAHLPPECKEIDLYGFLQSDIEFLFPDAEIDKSAVEIMADRWENDKIIRSVARNINWLLKEHDPELRIRALATFIPEISALDSTIRARGEGALIFLTKLLTQLQTLGHNEAKIIEIVGGNRVKDLWLGEEVMGEATDRILGPFLVANIQDHEQLFDDLSQSLVNVINRTRGDDISYALEIEPGPLFAMNTVEHASAFYQKFSREYQTASRRVGFNLDVAHIGVLLRMTPNDIRLKDNSVFADNILHAHISDHCIGHVCDHPLGTFTSPDIFREWISFLEKLRDKKDHPYQGSIALELEMGGEGRLHESWNNLKKILG